eukprot:4469303-Pyramimonas_sp.AAC.1
MAPKKRPRSLIHASSWEEHARNVSGECLARSIVVLSMCCGLDTPVLALQRMGAIPEAHSYDFEKTLLGAVQWVHDRSPGGGTVNVGKTDGDIFNVNPRDVPDVELAIAGPPCPPF